MELFERMKPNFRRQKAERPFKLRLFFPLVESHEGQANNFQKKSSTTKQRQSRHQSTSASDQSSAGNGGGGLGSILKGANVQGAVVEKGIEVMGKLVDKQLQIIDEAQEKAENFLKKEV